jgi:hypothetical protein
MENLGRRRNMSEPELVVTKGGVVTETYNVTVGGTFLTIDVAHENGYIRNITIHSGGRIIELANKQLQAILEVIKGYRVK